MDIQEYILQIVGTTGGGGLIGWLIARKKNKLEVKGMEVKNIEDNMALYQKFIDDMTKRNDERLADLESHYLERIKRLEEENEERFSKAESEYLDRIKKLERKIEELNRKLNQKQ